MAGYEPHLEWEFAAVKVKGQTLIKPYASGYYDLILAKRDNLREHLMGMRPLSAPLTHK